MPYRIIKASAHQTGLPDQSVHMIATSSPYYGLRAYAGDQAVEWPEITYAPMSGVPPIVIPGCDATCQHEWGDPISNPKYDPRTPAQKQQTSSLGNEGGKSTVGNSAFNAPAKQQPTQGTYCLRCGGMRCGLGAEPTVEAFIGHLLLVAREMWRVLRDDGTLWWNLGDSFNGSGGSGGDYGPGGSKEGQPKFPGRKLRGKKIMYKMRQDLTPEQKAYVLSELAKANSICDLTQDGRE